MKFVKAAILAVTFVGFGLTLTPQQAKADMMPLSQQEMEGVKGKGKCCNVVGQQNANGCTDSLTGRGSTATEFHFYKTCSGCFGWYSCPNDTERDVSRKSITRKTYSVPCADRVGEEPTKECITCVTGCAGVAFVCSPCN